MKYNLITTLLLFFFFQPLFGQLTIELPTVADCGNTGNPIGLLSASQSTTQGNNLPELAINGELNGTLSEGKASKTYTENNPYFQVTLEEQSVLSEVSIYYPSDLLPKGMGNYYILISDYPFENSNLSDKISSPIVESIYVDAPISSGTAIPLNNKSGRFVQIQLDGFGFISLTEIELLGIEPGNGGGVEICGNGEDDDCDGKIDCEDSDCGPTILNVNFTQPTTPLNEDGQIEIYCVGTGFQEFEYSIDDGNTWSDSDTFNDLPSGEYNIFVRNSSCVTEYELNPLTLQAETGVSHNHCPNGGFEEGVFAPEWIGDAGHNTQANGSGIPVYSPAGLDIDLTVPVPIGQGHQILPSSTDFDPNIGPGLPLFAPSGGLYLAKIGNESTMGLNAHRLTYCFEVEDPEFKFFYAVVLEDGNVDEPHDDNEQPFFEWRFLDVFGNLLPDKDVTRIESDLENPFFRVVNQRAYRGWTCVSENLSTHLGEEVCIQYTVADCSLQGHFGYAYIDALCEDNLAPVADEISMNDTYCQNQTVDASISGIASGFNQTQWRVCRFRNGAFSQCFSKENVIGSLIPEFENILGFFFDEHPNAGEIECGDKFQIDLILSNDCNQPTILSKEFTYLCEEMPEFTYPDLGICRDYQDIQIMSTGLEDCDNCVAEWTPGTYLNDETSLNPYILGTLNTLAYDQTYNVTITNGVGCRETDQVNIFNTLELMGDVSIETNCLNYCEQEMLFHLNFETLVDAESLNVQIEIDGANLNDYGCGEGVTFCNGEGFPFNYFRRLEGIPITTGENTLHSFSLPNSVPLRFDYEVTIRITLDDGDLPDEDLFIADGCGVDKMFTVESGNFHGEIDPYVPNAFNPLSSNSNNNTFGPFFNLEDSNVRSATLTIFDRWGGTVFQGSASVPPCGPGLTGLEPSLRWNGLNPDGEQYNSTVFVWTLDTQNCDYSTGCSDCSIEEIVNGDCEGCQGEGLRYGDVTLIY